MALNRFLEPSAALLCPGDERFDRLRPLLLGIPVSGFVDLEWEDVRDLVPPELRLLLLELHKRGATASLTFTNILGHTLNLCQQVTPTVFPNPNARLHMGRLAAQVDQMMKAPEGPKFLQVLDLTGNNLMDSDAENILRVVSACGNRSGRLVVLLRSNRLSPDGGWKLAEDLICKHGVSFVELTGNPAATIDAAEKIKEGC